MKDIVYKVSGWAFLAFIIYKKSHGGGAFMNIVKVAALLFAAITVFYFIIPKAMEWLDKRFGDGTGTFFVLALFVIICFIGMSSDGVSVPAWME